MEILNNLFGNDDNLSILQMVLRGIVIFILALAIVRISGKRSFGMRMPLDNVVTILLGAILSRAVVGASPFLPTVFTCVAIALFHRICSTLAYYNRFFGKLFKGEELILYINGKLNEKNLKRSRISKEDLIEGVRLTANVDSLEETECIHLERNGQISVIKKSNKSPV